MDLSKVRQYFGLGKQWHSELGLSVQSTWTNPAEARVMTQSNQTDYKLDLAIRLSRDNWNALAQQAYLRNVTK